MLLKPGQRCAKRGKRAACEVQEAQPTDRALSLVLLNDTRQAHLGTTLRLEYHALTGVCAESVEQDVDVPIIDDLLTRLPLEIEDARGDLFSILSLKRPHLELLLGQFVLNDAPLAYQARVEVVDLFVLI